MEQTDFDFETYLQCLQKLVAFPTLFSRSDHIETAMCWCQDFLTHNLKGYHIYRDRKRNLIACPEDLDHSRDIIYLSAHMDTDELNPFDKRMAFESLN